MDATLTKPAEAQNEKQLALTIPVVCHGIGPHLEDIDAILSWIDKCDIVLLGEATHGTHEFYEARALITQRLIEERDFNAVVVEADWPDTYRVNRFVRGIGTDAEAVDALADFQRFPQWMWRNAVVLDFVGWLRQFNDSRPPARKVGFYGMDLYSLYRSMQAVVNYLEEVDPPAAAIARARYACFDQFGADPQIYGYQAAFGLSETCRDAVVRQLIDLQAKMAEYVARDGMLAEDEAFAARQNARIAKNAEAYYRTMFYGNVASWNLRDRHMVETLDALLTHLGRRIREPKVVVWAHNSHLGDARATELAEHGELNVGQLVREKFGNRSYLVGFTTYTGTVSAASEWDGPVERKTVRPALSHSVEELFHISGVHRFMLNLKAENEVTHALEHPRLERAIGVIYRPDTERHSHYFRSRLRAQFDAIIHLDETRAVEPLERGPLWDDTQAPETFPTGL